MNITTHHLQCDLCMERATVDHPNDIMRPDGWADVHLHMRGDHRGETFQACPRCLQAGKLSALVERLGLRKRTGL